MAFLSETMGIIAVGGQDGWEVRGAQDRLQRRREGRVVDEGRGERGWQGSGEGAVGRSRGQRVHRAEVGDGGRAQVARASGRAREAPHGRVVQHNVCNGLIILSGDEILLSQLSASSYRRRQGRRRGHGGQE